MSDAATISTLIREFLQEQAGLRVKKSTADELAARLSGHASFQHALGAEKCAKKNQVLSSALEESTANKSAVYPTRTPAGRYQANSWRSCPYCNEHEITGGSFDVDSGYAAQEMTCSNCGASWVDSYRAECAINMEQGDVAFEEVSFSEARDLWVQLSDIAIDSGDLIDSEFIHFPKGTHRETIWRWFEKSYPGFIVGDVMQGKTPW